MKKSEALSALGLSEGATADDIKKAHRKLAIENHPDRFGQDEAARAAAEEKMKTINEARDVLESGKWDPEFRPNTGAPYTYDPFSGYRTTTSTTNTTGDPFFDGFPFGGTTFVWTSYDANGNPHTYRSGTTGSTSNQNPFEGAGTNPFDIPGSNPFGTSGANPFAGTPFADMFNVATPEEQLQDEQDVLKKEGAVIVCKLAACILAFFMGAPALGLYLYVIGSLGWSIYKNMSIIGTLFVIPLVILALIFAPSAASPVGFFGGLAAFLAVAWDVSDVRKRLEKIKVLKEQIGA